jgi:acyl-CoA reductase-like NAD-dependent aldehyde dehydrogenase
LIERNQIFIDGNWIRSSGSGTIAVVNPATEERIAIVPRGTAADVDVAVEAAARAFPTWSKTAARERAAAFRKLARLTQARSEEITHTIVSEVGEPTSMARATQTAGAVEELDIIADCLEDMKWSEQIGNTSVRREPAGVLGAITAWNAPLRSVISKAGAAMAAGCTVVLKGSEVAPLSSFIFAEMVKEAGIPDGVFNLMCGTGPEVGEAIASHPLVDMVSLTGSVRAGRRVMTLAAETVKRVHLELGGKSANVILNDADFTHAIVVGIEDAFRISGQVCGGLTRVLVPRHRLAEVEEIAVAAARTYVVGDPLAEATTLGPVTTGAQRDRVRAYIRSAQEDGVRMLTGGPDAPDGLDRGYFVRPTIFSSDNTTRIAREEIFGPVVVIISFEDEDDAVGIANDSQYGLAAAVWSADPEHARLLAGRLRVGRVRINGTPLNKWAPHGGFKQSGMGREWGRFGIEEFLEYQSVIG